MGDSPTFPDQLGQLPLARLRSPVISNRCWPQGRMHSRPDPVSQQTVSKQRADESLGLLAYGPGEAIRLCGAGPFTSRRHALHFGPFEYEIDRSRFVGRRPFLPASSGRSRPTSGYPVPPGALLDYRLRVAAAGLPLNPGETVISPLLPASLQLGKEALALVNFGWPHPTVSGTSSVNYFYNRAQLELQEVKIHCTR